MGAAVEPASCRRCLLLAPPKRRRGTRGCLCYRAPVIEREPADRASLAAASPGLLSSAAILVAALHVVCGCFTLCVTAPLLPDNLAIYLDAIDRARASLDPYRPFGIGSSFVYPPPALVLLRLLRSSLGRSHLPSGSSSTSGCTSSPCACSGWRCEMWVRLRQSAARRTRARACSRHRRCSSLSSSCSTRRFSRGSSSVRPTCSCWQVSLLFMTRDRPTPGWIGALGLAAAISIKISPILLLVVAIAGRDWRTVARVAGIVFALSVVAIGLYGWTPWAGFVAVLPSLAAGEAGLGRSLDGRDDRPIVRATGVTRRLPTVWRR